MDGVESMILRAVGAGRAGRNRRGRRRSFVPRSRPRYRSGTGRSCRQADGLRAVVSSPCVPVITPSTTTRFPQAVTESSSCCRSGKTWSNPVTKDRTNSRPFPSSLPGTNDLTSSASNSGATLPSFRARNQRWAIEMESMSLSSVGQRPRFWHFCAVVGRDGGPRQGAVVFPERSALLSPMLRSEGRGRRALGHISLLRGG
jgi:hypothetical protein